MIVFIIDSFILNTFKWENTSVLLLATETDDLKKPFYWATSVLKGHLEFLWALDMQDGI